MYRPPRLAVGPTADSINFGPHTLAPHTSRYDERPCVDGLLALMLDLLYPYLRIAVVAASLLYAVLLTQLAGQATCPTKAYNLGPCWRGQIDAISVPTLAHLTICHHPT